MNYTAPTPQYQDHECHYGDQSEPTPAMDDCSGEKHPQESFHYDGFQNKKFIFTHYIVDCQYTMRNARMVKEHCDSDIEKP